MRRGESLYTNGRYRDGVAMWRDTNGVVLRKIINSLWRVSLV